MFVNKISNQLKGAGAEFYVDHLIVFYKNSCRRGFNIKFSCGFQIGRYIKGDNLLMLPNDRRYAFTRTTLRTEKIIYLPAV